MLVDIENIDGSASGTMNDGTAESEDGDEKEQEQSVSEDEIAEEETSQINSMFLKQIVF